MRLATHSVQGCVHSSQCHQGLGVGLNLESHVVPSTIFLGAIHIQFQLAEMVSEGQSAAAGGGGDMERRLKSTCHPSMRTGI